MIKEKNILVKYEGEHIRIGVSKMTGKTYVQPINNSPDNDLWYRFEPEYYLDYECYVKDYHSYLKKDISPL